MCPVIGVAGPVMLATDPGRQDSGQRPRRHIVDTGEMAHLAGWSSFALAVEMQPNSGIGQSFVPWGLAVRPKLAEKLGHGRRAACPIAQRQPAHRPELLLELAGVGGFDGAVAAVVRAWRHLIDHQLRADHEHLDT